MHLSASASLLLSIALVCCLMSAPARAEMYNMRKRDGAYVQIDMDYGDNIYEKMLPMCDQFADSQECHLAMDTFSLKIYGKAFYTSTRPGATLEDFTITRTDINKYLLKRYSYSSYIEIGCASDVTFGEMRQLVQQQGDGVAHGVDPVDGGTHRMKSNDFFDALINSNSEQRYDLMFIDGDHQAEQVLLDVMHALRFLAPGGTIVMHDSNARHYEQQVFPPPPGNLAHPGDVWKVIPWLRLQDGLEVVTMDVDMGVTVVRRRPNRHRLPVEFERRLLLQPRWKATGAPSSTILEEFSFDELIAHREVLMRLVSVAEFLAWLDEEER